MFLKFVYGFEKTACTTNQEKSLKKTIYVKKPHMMLMKELQILVHVM